MTAEWIIEAVFLLAPFNIAQGPCIFHAFVYSDNFVLNPYVAVSSRARDLNFGQNLPLHPYLVYASRDGSGESVYLRRLA